MCVADRVWHAGGCAVLWQAVHPEGTDDHRKPGVLNPLPVKSWRQHQGINNNKLNYDSSYFHIFCGFVVVALVVVLLKS